MFKVRLRPSNVEFNVESEETILSAALKVGLVVPYGCKNGACGSCKASIVGGTVDYGDHQKRALSEYEKNNNGLLLCTAKPLSNIEITANLISATKENEPKKMPCRVEKIEIVTEDIAIIRLKLPANQSFSYLPGQYVDILLKDGKRRSYSMANMPNQENVIELHIKHNPGGLLTDSIFDNKSSESPILKEKNILRLEGPLGTFYFRENSKEKILFIASGTGIGPIKAIIENLISENFSREVILYWGVRSPNDLYILEIIESWKNSLLNFTFVPVVSDAKTEDKWKGREGYVHSAIMDDQISLKNFSVYACGSPLMVNAAYDAFTKSRDLDKDHFFSDAFTVASDSQK